MIEKQRLNFRYGAFCTYYAGNILCMGSLMRDDDTL